MADISVVIPVLSRPHRAALVTASLFANSEAELEVLFVCSPFDWAEQAACAATGENTLVVHWEPGPGDFAKKHNYAFSRTTADYVLLAADDLEFEPGWDTNVLAVASRQDVGVIGTQDDANPLVKRGKHSTHPVVSRRYIERTGGTWHDGPGTVYHEGYDHQWVDTELVAAAISRNEWAFAHNAVVRHLHPLYHRSTPMDSTYEKALGEGSADKRLFIERQQQAKHKK